MSSLIPDSSFIKRLEYFWKVLSVHVNVGHQVLHAAPWRGRVRTFGELTSRPTGGVSCLIRDRLRVEPRALQPLPTPQRPNARSRSTSPQDENLKSCSFCNV